MAREGWMNAPGNPNVSIRIADLTIDSEGRMSYEPLGFYTFAWLPKRCRNGKTRWLRWVERHEDGTYSLGNRAY